ncbi:TonB system transport protein ExbD [Rhizobium sp. YS-1r]|uniref:Biopolymer transport protein ExbD n=1 Tax=Neorhizobium phenanthreniclasticum TaxID=3157917 RepID=A0ABV0M9W3_9HYPH|nr:TonB system transport protein ExbD [Rhizobium sp. YS-1r]KGD98203.1 biopolymer transporter ExbD [Rhizobium sp. YS-1r]
MAGGIREHHGDDLSENHEINVTPFIDVMLVLLIIFMVAAPLATVDVNVDLPASTAKPAERPDEPLYLTVKEDLSLNIGNDAVARDQLAAALGAVTEGDKDTRIFLRADKAVDYGQFMEVMNLLRDAGYLKIALVGLETVPVQPTPSAGATEAPSPQPQAPPATPSPGAAP